MSLSSILSNYNTWIAILLVGGFVVWKFILEPILNDGEPIEPKEEDIPTFAEKMEDNLSTEVEI